MGNTSHCVLSLKRESCFQFSWCSVLVTLQARPVSKPAVSATESPALLDRWEERVATPAGRTSPTEPPPGTGPLTGTASTPTEGLRDSPVVTTLGLCLRSDLHQLR